MAKEGTVSWHKDVSVGVHNDGWAYEWYSWLAYRGCIG